MGIIKDAINDLKIDGHTKRGVYNTIAILESFDKEKIMDEVLKEMNIKSKNFSKIYDAIEKTLEKIE